MLHIEATQHPVQLRDGIVKNVMAKDLKSYTDEGWTILDVRPPSETRKVHVSDAVEVPLFVPDTSLDPSSLLKQMSAFGLGGWWLGGTHMKPNAAFMADVQAKVCNHHARLESVVCMSAVQALSEASDNSGYSTRLAIDCGWVCVFAEQHVTWD